MTACSSCHKALATADMLYTEDALPICAACSANREVVRDEKNAARNIKLSGLTSLGAGIAGFAAFYIGYGLFFYPAAIASVASGAYAGHALLLNDRFTVHMTPGDRTLTAIGTIGGLGIAGLETLILLGIIPFTRTF